MYKSLPLLLHALSIVVSLLWLLVLLFFSCKPTTDSPFQLGDHNPAILFKASRSTVKVVILKDFLGSTTPELKKQGKA